VATGRAIHPYFLELYRLDVEGQVALDPVGPATSGFDHDFGTPSMAATDDGKGEVVRVELAPVLVKAVIDVDQFGGLDMVAAGNDPQTDLRVFVHRRDLAVAGLLDSNEQPTIRDNDRVARVLDRYQRQRLVLSARPLYVTEVRISGLFGDLYWWMVRLGTRSRGGRA